MYNKAFWHLVVHTMFYPRISVTFPQFVFGKNSNADKAKAAIVQKAKVGL